MPHVTSHARYLPYKMTLSSEAEDINDEGLVEFTQNHCNESENGFMDKTNWHGDLIMSQSGHRRPPAAKPYYIRHHQRIEEHELRALIAKLEPRRPKFVFAVTLGRAGSTYLSGLFSTVRSAVVMHELSYQFTFSSLDRDRMQYIRYIVEELVHSGEDRPVFVDTGGDSLKFLPVISHFLFGFDVTFVVLRRDLPGHVLSWMRHLGPVNKGAEESFPDMDNMLSVTIEARTPHTHARACPPSVLANSERARLLEKPDRAEAPRGVAHACS
jgi:hypothetical protein